MNRIRQNRNNRNNEAEMPILLRFGKMARNFGDLATDVYHKEGKIIAEVNVPGVDPEDIRITFEDNYLKISGDRKSESQEEEKNYYYHEIQRGHFERFIKMPYSANFDEAEACFENGKLVVEIPTTRTRGAEKVIPIKKKL